MDANGKWGVGAGSGVHRLSGAARPSIPNSRSSREPMDSALPNVRAREAGTAAGHPDKVPPRPLADATDD